jgi:hypothetical protein
MGNRAVIAYREEGVPKEQSTAIYLHWNGGRDSVEGFLKVANQIGVRSSQSDYAMARLTQIIGNFFGDTLSVGVGIYKRMDTDNYDNGVYWISSRNGKLTIVDREFNRNKEQTGYSIEEFSKEVFSCMPESYKQETKQTA